LLCAQAADSLLFVQAMFATAGLLGSARETTAGTITVTLETARALGMTGRTGAIRATRATRATLQAVTTTATAATAASQQSLTVATLATSALSAMSALIVTSARSAPHLRTTGDTTAVAGGSAAAMTVAAMMTGMPGPLRTATSASATALRTTRATATVARRRRMTRGMMTGMDTRPAGAAHTLLLLPLLLRPCMTVHRLLPHMRRRRRRRPSTLQRRQSTIAGMARRAASILRRRIPRASRTVTATHLCRTRATREGAMATRTCLQSEATPPLLRHLRPSPRGTHTLTTRSGATRARHTTGTGLRRGRRLQAQVGATASTAMSGGAGTSTTAHATLQSRATTPRMTATHAPRHTAVSEREREREGGGREREREREKRERERECVCVCFSPLSLSAASSK
jgi:hypothetical protein